MPPFDAAVSLVTAALAATGFGGLIFRRRVRACVLFAVYLASAVLGHLLIVAFPATFWTWEFWAVTDAIQAAIQLGIAFEITAKTFRPLPRGYKRMRVVMGLLSIGIAVGVALLPHEVENAFELTLVVERVFYGVALHCLAFMAVVRYYGVAVDPLHRDIATGLGFLTLLMSCASALSQFDPVFGLGHYFVSKTAYPCLLAWWVVSAWRREDFGLLSPEAVRVLQPWRVR